MTKLTRKELLIKLEKIVGSSCYNGNIKNWGANGEWLGEGRAFRYPIRINGLRTRTSIKGNVTDYDLQVAYYAFGANQLHIIRALDEALDFIEYKYGVDIPKTKLKLKRTKQILNKNRVYILWENGCRYHSAYESESPRLLAKIHINQ
ncbi:TPA: hypothetical protein ACX6RP_003017 [Photobacterium damselae]